jgi:hypothetical protein
MTKIKIGEDIIDTTDLPEGEQVVVKNFQAAAMSVQDDQNSILIFQKARTALLIELKSEILKLKTGIDFGEP